MKKIPPQHYLHVIDNNTNVVRLEIGPLNLLLRDQESAVYGPSPFIIVPPQHYVTVTNPVVTRLEEGKKVVCYDENGQARLHYGKEEIRLDVPPFPLYPGELINGRIMPLEVVPPATALRLQAIIDFYDEYHKDDNGKSILRRAGEEWLFKGPATYTPQPESRIVYKVGSQLIKKNQAIKLEALKDFTDITGKKRKIGEQWLYEIEGAYLPEIEEKIIKVENRIILTNIQAILLKANITFTDVYGIKRFAGEKYLITSQLSESHLPNVHEEFIQTVPITSISQGEWVKIKDPFENGKVQYGKEIIIKGQASFFLNPCEAIVEKKNVDVLTAENALVVRCVEDFVDNSTGVNIHRKAGEKWIIYGPTRYYPPLQVNVLVKVNPILKLGSLYIFRPEIIPLFGMVSFVILYVFWKFISLFM